MNRRQIQMSGGGQTVFSIIDEDPNNEMPDVGWNDTQLAKASNISKVSQYGIIFMHILVITLNVANYLFIASRGARPGDSKHCEID